MPAFTNLTVSDIEKVISQGVAEAQAQGQPSGFVVIDRVGNVLAVFVMNGANLTLRIPPAPNGQNTDLQNLQLPAPAALAGGISKALTSSYFSSVGGAFSSRTANDIVQETFPPSRLTRGLESGPLFSVQFSQLPCSDVSRRFIGYGQPDSFIGTKRGPLGVGADPGAFPLYKNGAVVGSVAVVGDGVYGLDTEYGDNDNSKEEIIALAATRGFEPNPIIRADRISIDGTLLRWSDATPNDFKSSGTAPAFASINGSVGNLVSVRGYYDAAFGIQPGTVYGSEASGIRPSKTSEYSDSDIWVVSDGFGNNRYPPRAGTDAAAVSQPLSETEVRTILVEAFDIQRRARAQVRRPVDNRAQNTIVVVDTFGEILGLVRGPDALVDAIDAVPQKARTTVFFSNPAAAGDLQANPNPAVQQYVGAFRNFLGDPTALTGKTAFSVRAVGNLARPFYPDGQVGTEPGPLSIPAERFNIFSTGLQSTLITPDIVAHVGFVLGASPTDVPQTCTRSPEVRPGFNRINNGLTLFAGGVPIYRGGQLIGAVASSGDGDDQSDMIAFLGLDNASKKLGGIGNAALNIRSDQLKPKGQQLTFIACPFAPFIGTNDQNVCQGK
ncbi:heme-binding protein [Allosphingosinicella indica]|uniref:heme-binding protein n=1 Tax=Allosphingosinicella indica TaxID=941907 RepID=UPI0031397BB0